MLVSQFVEDGEKVVQMGCCPWRHGFLVKTFQERLINEDRVAQDARTAAKMTIKLSNDIGNLAP